MRFLLLSLMLTNLLGTQALAQRGGVHGGGGGNSYCAEFSDLYESIKSESSHTFSSTILCTPAEDLSTVLEIRQNKVYLHWNKWSRLSTYDKLWETSQVLLVQSNKTKPVTNAEVSEFLQELLNSSPVFLKYKMFEALSGNGSEVHFEKPSITVQARPVSIGYEAWCWYMMPCSRLRFEPEIAERAPDVIALSYCNLLGFQNLKEARWSQPIEHSIVPGLIPGSKSIPLAKITNGVFNGTFQTHAFGQGAIVILQSVTCGR